MVSAGIPQRPPPTHIPTHTGDFEGNEHFGSTKRIENVYDAEGLKLSQKLVNGSATITTDYMGDLIYRNDSLKTILHDEGRIAYQNDSTYAYQFFLLDHLGNTRAIVQRLNATTALVQENHYGAWGEVLEGIGTQGNWNFLYQGKEFISDYGYDFHARSYDTWSGRFDGIDPVDNYSISGFAGMANNPATFIDPDGKNPLVAAIVIGAIIGGASYAINTAMQPGGFRQNWNWGQFGISVGVGAISGAFTYGIGEAAQTLHGIGKFAFQAGMHGSIGGFSSVMQGGSFGSGFLTGVAGSAFGSATARLPKGLQIGGSALFSGAVAELSGGNFWQGAAQGGIIAGFNHVAHSINEMIARTAESYIGSEDWAYDKEKDNFKEGTWKCNKFCYDVLQEAGAETKYTRYGLSYDLVPLSKDRPYKAGEWGNPDFDIPNWKVVSKPSRGDVAAYKAPYDDATGHVGIVTGGGKGVWANKTVIRQDFINNTTWNTTHTIIYRRYVGRIR